VTSYLSSSTCSSEELDAALQRVRPAAWAGTSALVERGDRVSGRFVDQRIIDVTTRTGVGAAVRCVTDRGLLYRSADEPRVGLAEELLDLYRADTRPARQVPPAGRPRPADVASDITSRTLKLILGWLREADRAARGLDRRVTQFVADFDVSHRQLEVSCDGTHYRDDRLLSYLTLRAIARDGTGIATGTYTPGSSTGLGVLSPEACGVEAARRAVGGLGARPAPVGRLPVVVAGGRGIVLIHEACCHPLEGDEVLRGSVYAGAVGMMIASSVVSIVDDATVPGATGTYRVDDEGTLAGATTLVDRGVLRGFLTDQETAHHLGADRTGNGRCRSVLDPPLPRMTNTCLLPGHQTRDEIILNTGLGVYAEHVGGGEVIESTGQFVFRVTNGYMIRDGEIAEAIQETTIAGTGTEVLRNIDAVADDVAIGAARCGKFGQFIPVGVVGPTLRVSELLVGGTS